MVGGCHSINQCTACVVRTHSIMPASPILPNIDFSLFSQIFSSISVSNIMLSIWISLFTSFHMFFGPSKHLNVWYSAVCSVHQRIRSSPLKCT